jgi:PPOX class probable FMN-dependent enzyme
MVTPPDVPDAVNDPGALRACYGSPSDLAVKKQLAYLDRHCRRFIELSPFVVIGSQGADGLGDVSPRGDAPGFVRVLDEVTLAIPDRPGNNRIDTLSNVVENPGIGLLFLIPGFEETLRVNGHGRIVMDPALLATMTAQSRPPRSALVVNVKEAYLQCSKALVRSRLWAADSQTDRRTMPTLGQIIADQVSGVDAAVAEERIQESIKSRLY